MANNENDERSLSEIIKDVVLSTPGVASLQDIQPLTEGVLVINIFGRKEIDIFVNVNFGINIPALSWNLQNRVKNAIQGTDMENPDHINIHIEGVYFNNVSQDQQQI